MQKKWWFPFIVIVLFLSIDSSAQYGSFGVTDARSMGMGNTYNATTFDLYAIGKNPGLLSNKEGEHKDTYNFPNLDYVVLSD